MPARATGDNANLLKVAELLLGNPHFVEEDFAGILRDAAQEGVPYGARLLEDFLLHEMLVAAFFRHDGIPGDIMSDAVDGAAVVIHHANAVLGEDGDVAVSEEENFASVLEKSGDIAGDKIFVIAEADDGGRADAGSNNFLGVSCGEKD